MTSTTTIVDIPIECRIVTAQTVSSMVAAIVDLLMFQRKQIPLVYQTFSYMVEKLRPLLEDGATDEADDGWDAFLIERERRLALATLDSIKALKRVIAQQIDRIDIDRMMILFGPNAQMATEAYEIRLPRVDRQHHGENHRKDDVGIVRQVSMKVLSASNLFEMRRNYRPTAMDSITNAYVLLHPRNESQTCPTERFIVHDGFDMHPDVWLTTFDLRNTYKEPFTTASIDDVSPNCCDNLVVFTDRLATLTIAEMVEKRHRLGAVGVVEKKKKATAADAAAANDEDDAYGSEPSGEGLGAKAPPTRWYESEQFATGFKEVQVQGKSIWV